MGFISKSILEDILSFNRFPDTQQLSDSQNEALFGILNRDDARLLHLTDRTWKINHIPVPSRSFPRIIFKRVSLSKECHCGSHLPVKFPRIRCRPTK